MKYVLCSYVKIRKRSLEQCTEDVVQTLSRLFEIDGEIFCWKKRGRSKKKAMENPFIDHTEFEIVLKLLQSGVNRNDVDRSPIPDLGFQIGLWNGSPEEEKTASLSYIAGSYSPYVSNSFVLEFPEIGQLPHDRDLSLKLIDVAVNALDAETALLYRHDAKTLGMERPFLDIALYLARGYSVERGKLAEIEERASETLKTQAGIIYLS